jgi:PIN domain nuclease of toxin-antitoxin system
MLPETFKPLLLDTNIFVWLINGEKRIASTRLPDGFHGDPADRIVVASANCIQAGIVTNDREIVKYCSRHDVPSFSV